MDKLSFPLQPDQVQTPEASIKTHHSKLAKLLITIVVVSITVAIFSALYGWRQWRQQAVVAPAEWSPVTVSAMVLTPTNVPAFIKTVGSLRAVHEVILSPETAGRVMEIGFTAGQTIEAGSALVQLYDGPERAEREAALARADLAKAQLERSMRLNEKVAQSREILDQRSAELDQALAAVKRWDAHIEQKRIRAPFTGQLGLRQINLGQYLEPGDAIATLTDTRQLFVDFSVPQQQLRWLKEKGVVRVKTDAWPNREFLATVDSIEPRVNHGTRNISVRALLPNPDNVLRSGMYVNAELELPLELNQLVVPSTAMLTTPTGDNVLVIRGPNASNEGQAEYVRVKIGRRLVDRAVISEGLQPGDVVITGGQLRVPPGAQVQVTQLLSALEI